MNGPLRLATGSHIPGSGAGCAMNVESWINGDTEITDFPDCADRGLAWVVQQVNDNMCRHTRRTPGQSVFLCPDCSMKVLALAARTRGTRLHGWSDDERAKLFAQVNEVNREFHVTRPEDLLVWAHLVIDRFEEVSGVRGISTDVGVSESALRELEAARA